MSVTGGVRLLSCATASGQARHRGVAAPTSAGRREAAQVRFFSDGRVIKQSVKDFGAESITEGTLVEFRKKAGDAVTKGEVIASIETDKVTVEVNAEESGSIKELFAAPDDNIVVGQDLFSIEVGAAGAAASAPAAASPTAAASAAPSAAAPAGELTGIRLGFAKAAAARSGAPIPGAAAAAPKAAAAAAKPAAAQAIESPASAGQGRLDKRVPMSYVRRRVVQRLKESQNTLALITTFQEADLTASIALRDRYKDVFQKTNGTQLGLLSFFVKACATGLTDIPGVNGTIDDAAGEIVYRDYADISIPIPSPRGPVSCIVRNAESKTLREIERDLAGLADRARRDALLVEDLGAPTFGIADSGMVGGMLGTNFINPPSSATLGTNAVQQRACVVDGKVVARPMMYLSLTYDHRLVDGREAATFLGSVRDKLEDPSRMLLEC